MGRLRVRLQPWWEANRIDVLLACLLFPGWLLVAFLLLQAPTFTQTRVVHVGRADALRGASAGDVAAVWGGQKLDGGQVNQQLTGWTCVVNGSKRTLICWQ